MAFGITCAACDAALSLDRDLLARRFLVSEAQRRLPVPAVLRSTSKPEPIVGLDVEEPPALDYSRAVYQYLLGCASCLAITRTDRPVAVDDVVPGRISLAVPAAVTVRATRRLESAAAAGRTGRELRSLCADPVRRYAARIPAVFRAARPGFADALMLTADAIFARPETRHVGPHGLVWDDGPRLPKIGRRRLRRLVRRAEPDLERECEALPFERGTVSVWRRRFVIAPLVRFGRGTRFPIVGEDGAAFLLGPPRVRFAEERHQRYYERLLPEDGLVVTLDLAVPA